MTTTINNTPTRTDHRAHLSLAEVVAFDALPPEAQRHAALIRLLPTLNLHYPTDYETALALWAIRSNSLELVAAWWVALWRIRIEALNGWSPISEATYVGFWRNLNNRAVAEAELARKVFAGLPQSTREAMVRDPKVWAGAAIRLYDLGVAPCGLCAKGLWERGKELLPKPPKGAKAALDEAIKRGYARRTASKAHSVSVWLRPDISKDACGAARAAFRCNYRMSTTKWAGENRIDAEMETTPGISAYTGRAWSKNGKWSGTDLVVRITIAPSATKARIFAFGAEHRALLLAYREVAEGLVKVTYAKQGRSLEDITAVQGWLCNGHLLNLHHSTPPEAVRKAASRKRNQKTLEPA